MDRKAEGLWQQASRGDEAALDELLVGFMPRLEAFVRTGHVTPWTLLFFGASKLRDCSRLLRRSGIRGFAA